MFAVITGCIAWLLIALPVFNLAGGANRKTNFPTSSGQRRSGARCHSPKPDPKWRDRIGDVRGGQFMPRPAHQRLCRDEAELLVQLVDPPIGLIQAVFGDL